MHAIDPGSLRSAQPQVGPVLSLLTHVDPKSHLGYNDRTLMFDYSYLTEVKSTDPKPLVQTVMEPLDGRADIVLPASQAAGRWDGGWGTGTDNVTVPRDVGPGKYRVFYRFVLDGKVIGIGNGFVATLPEDLSPPPPSTSRWYSKSLAIGAVIIAAVAVPIVLCKRLAFGKR